MIFNMQWAVIITNEDSNKRHFWKETKHQINTFACGPCPNHSSGPLIWKNPGGEICMVVDVEFLTIRLAICRWYVQYWPQSGIWFVYFRRPVQSGDDGTWGLDFVQAFVENDGLISKSLQTFCYSIFSRASPMISIHTLCEFWSIIENAGHFIDTVASVEWHCPSALVRFGDGDVTSHCRFL